MSLERLHPVLCADAGGVPHRLLGPQGKSDGENAKGQVVEHLTTAGYILKSPSPFRPFLRLLLLLKSNKLWLLITGTSPKKQIR